jgi:hypothetical protein
LYNGEREGEGQTETAPLLTVPTAQASRPAGSGHAYRQADRKERLASRLPFRCGRQQRGKLGVDRAAGSKASRQAIREASKQTGTEDAGWLAGRAFRQDGREARLVGRRG